VISPRFVLRMAWRESRAEAGHLALLVGAVAIGVAALVATNSFTANLQDSVRLQARALLGADLSFSSRRPFPRAVEATLDSLPATALARLTNFPAMAYVARTAGTRLVQASAIEGAFPFYGEIKTAPGPAWADLQSARHVVVDPALLPALGAHEGDSLTLGEARFLITGTIQNLPGEVGIRTAFGPRIFIPARYLDDTRLLVFGSQAERQVFVKLRDGVSAQALAQRLRPTLNAQQVRVRTVADDRENLSNVLTRLSKYLGLIALIALLLAGVGVASAVLVFIRRKLDTIAVLRCLGATAGQVFAIYLAQALALGLAGSVTGAAAGVLVQQGLPALLRELLPLDVRPELVPGPIALAIGLGVWTAFIFALLPLLGVRLIAPLAAIRRPYEATASPRDPWRWPGIAALVASVIALASLEIGSWRTGGIFAAGIGVTLGALWLAAWLLVRGVRRWFPGGWPYVWRQGLANLLRRFSAGDAIPGAAQPAAWARAHRRRAPAQSAVAGHSDRSGGGCGPRASSAWVAREWPGPDRADADSLGKGKAGRPAARRHRAPPDRFRSPRRARQCMGPAPGVSEHLPRHAGGLRAGGRRELVAGGQADRRAGRQRGATGIHLHGAGSR
jgi:putative ABC transport system permease protein